MFLSSPDGGMEDLTMIDFDEEIKKFQPILEVEDAEDAIYNKDIPDITDVLGKIMAEASDSNSNKKNK